jgi:PAS domain S-box-containing protein
MKKYESAEKWLLTFLSIYALGFVGFVRLGWSTHFPLPFLPAGIAMAGTYRWGRWMCTPVFAAQFAVELSLHEPLLAAAAAGAGLAAGPVLSSWLLDTYGFDSSFGRARDVPVFLFAVVAGTTVTSAVGLAGFILAGIPPHSTEPLRCLRWWSNTTAGALLVGPALIAFSRQSMMRFSEHWVEGAGWIVGVAICCCVIVIEPGPTGRSLLIMVAILLIVAGAIRLGLVVSAAGAAAISTTAAFSFALGFGMFGQFNDLAGRLTLLSFSATLVAAILLITALLAERDAAALARLQAERRYAQIFNGSPQAIWVHDKVERRFLLVNEAAQRQYGRTMSEFLASDVSVLAPPGETPILPLSRPSSLGGYDHATPFETRHVTKAGRILEVEVWMRSIDLGGRAAELVFAIDVSGRKSLGKVLIDALAGEQRRIAGEIHDGLGQELTGLALSLRALATRAKRSEQPGAADLDDLAKLAARCIEGSKKIVQGLSPLSDAGGSLESALDALARRASLSGTPVRFRSRGDARLAVSTEVLDHFYRIAQEAVQNALKHAAAAAIDIELYTHELDVRLSIVDDGKGLPDNVAVRQGLGMRTMHFRAGAIGGSLSLETPSGGGTAVRCEVLRHYPERPEIQGPSNA